MSLLLDNFSVGYRNTPIIKSLSLPSIPAGSLVAVLGPNGVGKSTLLRAMARLLPFHGELTLNGESVDKMAVAQSARCMGYLPQTLPQATSLVAYEIAFSACRAVKPELSKSYIEQMIEHTFFKLGISHLAFKRLSELSGGQRQMIGLAQVLIREPQLLLLDEPTSALDLHWQISVLQTVKQEIQQCQAIGLVAIHDINLALRFCDQLLVLGPHGLLAMGEPKSVLTPDILQQAYGIRGRVEKCSKGYPIVLVDEALSTSMNVNT